MRGAVDARFYVADWHADITTAREASEAAAETTGKNIAETSFSDLSGAEMEQMFLDSFTRAASMDQGSGFER